MAIVTRGATTRSWSGSVGVRSPRHPPTTRSCLKARTPPGPCQPMYSVEKDSFNNILKMFKIYTYFGKVRHIEGLGGSWCGESTAGGGVGWSTAPPAGGAGDEVWELVGGVGW